MRTITVSRYTIPVILFFLVAAVLVLFFFATRDSVHQTHRRLRRRTEHVNDKFEWTTRNCKTGMQLLLDLCPCVAEIDIRQGGDKAANELVDCVYNCIAKEANETIGEYNDDDAEPAPEDNEDSKGEGSLSVHVRNDAEISKLNGTENGVKEEAQTALPQAVVKTTEASKAPELLAASILVNSITPTKSTGSVRK